MFNIAICEDDLNQQQIIKALLTEIGYDESFNIHIFGSGEELIQSYADGNRYSIILLDMQMNELNGIQTAKVIKEYDSDCLFIIITSIIEYAVDGYSIGAYDFILKPIVKDKFHSVINSAVREWQNNMSRVYIIKSRDRLTSIRLSEISYIESYKNKVIIYMNDESYIDNMSITNMEKKLGKDGFIRISRYYIVNISHAKEIRVNKVILGIGKELIYSEKYRESIKKEYLNYMMGDLG